MSTRFLKPVSLTAILFALIHVFAGSALTGQNVDNSNQSDNPEILAQDEPVKGLTYSNPVKTKWKVTTQIVGASTAARNMFISIPVPNTWPEQSVAPAEEDIPPEIGNVKYRDLDSGVRQLIINIPTVGPGQEVTISMTFLVSTSQINAPEDPSVFLRPKTSHRDGRDYLGISPQINFKDSKLRKQVKEITADKDNLWAEVEAIYDWVRDNIEDDNLEPKDSLAVFKDKTGCNEDKVRLFVGMCRAHKIPARMVWVEGTQHAEFMLVDSQANAHWFPCKVGGVREFGAISEPRIVLQKGDSIRVPEKEGRQKFVAEFAVCKGTSKPSVKFFRQLLPAE